MTVKELKTALLQEAVQGKLVPQISSEGNARDLLEEIRKEKLSHGLDLRLEASLAINAKSGKRKSKKETALAGSNPCDITEDEIPFEIPENWCWCRLGDLGLYRKGPFGSSLTKSMFVPKSDDSIKVYEQKNAIKKDFSLGEYYISKEKFETMQSFIVEPSDIIVSCAGTIGEVYKLPHEAPIGIINQALMRVKLFNDNLSSFWMMYFDYVLKKEAAKQGSGTAIKNIPPFEILKAYPFPLPPLAEQKRIVAAIEKFMPLIEEYGKKETQLKAINEKIGTLTKKAILQEAVQGKLVPQIAAEGNARDLLEEIRKEKLSHGLDFANAKSGKRKSKKETALAGSNPCDITEEEIPFDIPENWCWCRLGEICNEIKRGKSPKYADKSNYLAFAQKCNVKIGGIDLGLALYLDEKSITRYSETDNLVQGDIVINSTGGGTMGRVGLYETKVPAGIKGVYPDSHVTVIRSIGNINQHYLYYVLKLNQPVLEKCGTGSTNQTELKPAVLADFVIPLPPLAEQKRIVKAIEKLLPLCEALKV